MNLPRVLSVALACLFWGNPGAAQTRELHWQSLDVRAHLDADGALHVRETQAIVFDGAWNGGERRFSIRAGQRLKFEHLLEKDASGGTVREFLRGDLDRSGAFRLFDGNVLRWRNRMPEDPPFQDEIRIYELDYVVAGVLRRQGEHYLLSHDFAFPDRSGVIEHLHGELTFDPSWRSSGTPEVSFDVDALQPGQGAVRSVAFEYLGTGHPLAQGEVRSAPGGAADLVWVILVVMVFAGAIVVIQRERARGRFEPLDSPDSIDAAWLAENLLCHRPEDVGAAWDGDISTQEVMAILARMSQAGQLTSEVKVRGRWIFKYRVLHLRLLVNARSLPPTERALIRKLFFDGPTTDTDRIRAHYRSRGFDPAAVISRYVKPRAETIAGRDEDRPSWYWKTSVTLIGAGIAVVVTGACLEPGTAGLVAMVALGTLLALIIAVPFARGYRNAPTARLWPVLVALVLVGGVLGVLRWVLHSTAISSLECLGVILLAAGMLHVLLTAFLCRRSAEHLRRRRRFLAARRYFQRELRQRVPRLDDAWFPYLLAFGLGPDMDRWFKVSGSTATGSASSGSSGGSTGHTSVHGTSAWTGGGGAFAGAGATATWVSAVGTLAAGVAPPSSGGGSSSGGGGGGGGGSSGGGGGGGW